MQGRGLPPPGRKIACVIVNSKIEEGGSDMSDDTFGEEQKFRKLCLNCAYRANCIKRFSVKIVNGEVRCMDYTQDLELLKEKKEDEKK
jgi:hypothetical protein